MFVSKADIIVCLFIIIIISIIMFISSFQGAGVDGGGVGMHRGEGGGLCSFEASH